MSDFLQFAIDELHQKSKNALYLNDPVLWAKEVLDINLWSKQRELVESVVTNKKTAVKSCHSSGKSFSMAVLACWWVSTRADQDAIVVSTAPTYEQVNKILWESIRKNHSAFNLIGKVTQDDEWKLDDGTVVGFGRKPADTNIHGFHGIHRPGGVLALLDEGCGLHQNIFTAVEAITTGELDRIVTVGNPDDANTEFGRIFLKDDPGWNKITIAAKDTPNFTGEEGIAPQAKKSLIGVDWVEDKKVAWGEGSPRWMSKIEGEFSTETSSTLFTLADINRGISTELLVGEDTKCVLGVDVARMGEDETVVYSNTGGIVRLEGKWSKKDTLETAEAVDDIARRCSATEVRVDGAGLGVGVVDYLAKRLADGSYTVISLVGNTSSPDLMQWANSRAFWWDTARKKMSNGELDISFEDQQLQDELLSVRYHFNNTRNSLQVEKKEDLRTRTGKSPDYADAFIYAVADLGFDIYDPVQSMAPGTEFALDVEELLWDMDTAIGVI